MKPNHAMTIAIVLLIVLCRPALANVSAPTALRIATFNIEDVRSTDLDSPDTPRLQQIAAIIQRIRPNVLLLSELALRSDGTQSNADRFVDLYLGVSQGPGLKPMDFNTFTPASNTGLHSGHDLDNSGTIDPKIPEITPRQTARGRTFGNDCYGFGTFPGQYAMALLVDPRLTIEIDAIRTFQHFLWKDLPGATAPTNPDGSAWYSPEEWNDFRLASKVFADIPIRLPSGTVLHALISHPTPPAFDGAEGRNKHRNHDEIKLIRHYIDNDQSLYDDRGQQGGLEPGAHFVILGDLNADPVDGSSLHNVMQTQLLSSALLAQDCWPSADIAIDGLDPTDTAGFRLRVDYALPSRDISVSNSGVWRYTEPGTLFPSDHFPVWIEVIIP